ncbi:unnamed protein product [Penicillium glandicola]
MDTNHVSLDRAFILKLPDEVLDTIIGAMAPVIHDPRCFREHYQVYGMATVLSLVCRRFYRIAVSHLYAELVISASDDTQGQPNQFLRHLHRSFRENPSLWKLCRHLTLTYDKSNTGNLYVATDCFTWLTAVKTLTFRGLEGKKAWELLQSATKHMPSCNALSISARHVGNYDLHLLFVIDALGDFKPGIFPHLQKLRLSGVSFYGDQMCQAELKKKAGTAPFTKLQLRSFLLSPESLEALVRWSRRLEEFELRYSFGDDFGSPGLYSDWSLATMQPILSIHRKILRSIKLYGLNRGGMDGFDLRKFENLEELSLSAQLSGHQCSNGKRIPEPPDRLLSPRLGAFRWDFTILDQQYSEMFSDFGQAEEDWLRLFAHKALQHGCPLHRIDIKFTPEDDIYGAGDEVYPWDRMDSIKTDLRQYGIEVSYNPPCVGSDRFFMNLHNFALENPEMDAEVERIRSILRTRGIFPMV